MLDAHFITTLATSRPRLMFAGMAVLTLALGALIPRLQIDTDPENMLPDDQPARVFHRSVKADFALNDFIVVGVVNSVHPDGVFNRETLARVHGLTRAIERIDGVVVHELLSLATVDDVRPEGSGQVRFDWMMQEAPSTDVAALAIRDATRRQPMLQGTLVSEDEQAAAIYVPIESKSESHRIAGEVQAVIADFTGDEQYHITGLPVAEETFGIEMFMQMGVAAPLAGLVVFIMLWIFFRSISLIIAPMLVAPATVISTMGLLIGFGFPVHIMSSMIPIFLMPIAVVDSVHILSEFADRYRVTQDRLGSLREVMHELFTPMLYTSLTSAVGFASLAFAPIPPVRVFGLFVAFGILLAFVLTITFIPAYISRMSDRQLGRLLRASRSAQERASRGDTSLIGRSLALMGRLAVRQGKVIVVCTAALVVLSVLGIMKITINDNPVRWFRSSHQIRIADRVLNEHFAGTYDAYLVLQQDAEVAAPGTAIPAAAASEVVERSGDAALASMWAEIQREVGSDPDALIDAAYDRLDAAQTDAEAAVWEDVLAVLEGESGTGGVFREPEMLAYVEKIQAALHATHHVGKTNALPDIVKTVHRALRDGDDAFFTIPASTGGVAQTLLSYQSSHRPNDLWHFVTPDYDRANIWIQLTSGDNQDMVAVKQELDAYLAAHPPPTGMTVSWAGLTPLNVVWQEAMVQGMLNALLGSFAIVFFMMLLLFRSFWFGLLAMLPLTVTIVIIYGLVGWTGKDYDMPIAVLSSLTLGLSIDFAIHFLQRTRAIQSETGDWMQTMHRVFAQPARAIARNALVIAVGFSPLLLSPLVPYNTVGLFLAAIMLASCLVTLMLLPSALHLGRRGLFKARSTEAQAHTTAA